MDLGHWLLSEDIAINESTFGFIYEITNTVTNKKYIGKKQCQSKIKRQPLKGKKNKRILTNGLYHITSKSQITVWTVQCSNFVWRIFLVGG